MGDSRESVIRKFFDTWPRSDVNEMIAFFSNDAVYTDGPRGTFKGKEAIKTEMEALVELVPTTTPDVKNLVVSDSVVMVERIDVFQMAGETFDVEMAAVFEVNSDGLISRWRDYYDLRSLEERVAERLGSASTGS
ncbi:nuclear transport factor 2 family protein [Mycobacterium sp. 852002-51163_SCH5372311]|uniref:nuclear transport factor 2 family protein n=1 Tax=Mycobacterium sp. 852002-51163_SCH5372311 TaxID=1834097 RepID=UPI000B10BAE6|nr:nuclear transport factor 2 family protein [Mycobacterium sp. 852002-51163_SCH5372311]